MNDKPRILMLVHRFPYPPNRGDRIRAFHLLKFLSQNFNVSLACPTHEAIDAAHLRLVQSLVSDLAVVAIDRRAKYLRAAWSVARGASLSEGFFAAPSLPKLLQRWHRQHPFDAILIVCSSMYRYRALAKLTHIPTVVDLVDVDSQKWKQLSVETPGLMRYVYRLEHRRTVRLEAHIAHTATAVALTSHQEVELFRQCCPVPVPAYGIGNGVDTHYFHPAARTTPSPNTTPAVRLVFTGVMDYPPNIDGMLWFCREVWPAVIDKMPATLHIVGRHPTHAIKCLTAIPGVNVVGEVPDVRPYLQSADIAIAPLLLARGIQNKVLEAMASGLPTVATPQAAEGIAVTPGIHLQVADGAAYFAQALIRLGTDPHLRTAMGAAGRQFVEQNHSWAAQLAPFRELLDRSIASTKQLASS